MLKFSYYNEELLSFKIRHVNKPLMISCNIFSTSITASKVLQATKLWLSRSNTNA